MGQLQGKKSIFRHPITLSFLVFIVGYFLFIDPSLDRLERVERDEYELKDTFEFKHNKLVNKDLLKLQMREMDQMFQHLRGLLPYKIDINAKNNEIIKLADTNGVEVEEMEFNRERVFEFYIGIPFQLHASGHFDDLYYFIYDVFYKSGIAMGLRDFTIQHVEADGKQHLDIDGYLYRKTPEE